MMHPAECAAVCGGGMAKPFRIWGSYQNLNAFSSSDRSAADSFVLRAALRAKVGKRGLKESRKSVFTPVVIYKSTTNQQNNNEKLMDIDKAIY